MQIITPIITEEVSPKSFASLMDLYEGNYLRLRKLIPNIHELNGEAVSSVDGCLDLSLKIIERSKFTTTLSLTYYFDYSGKSRCSPNLQLRIYHDAGLAEALCGHLLHGRMRLTCGPDTAMREKWRLNRFLYKWLGYCLHQGHGFDSKVVDPIVSECVRKMLHPSAQQIIR